VLAPDLNGLEPRLTQLGYPVKALCPVIVREWLSHSNNDPAHILALVSGSGEDGKDKILIFQGSIGGDVAVF
jgi:hypothetical protein